MFHETSYFHDITLKIFKAFPGKDSDLEERSSLVITEFDKEERVHSYLIRFPFDAFAKFSLFRPQRLDYNVTSITNSIDFRHCLIWRSLSSKAISDLFINSAVQIDVSGNKKAVVVHVPYRLRKAFKKIHVRLVRELEKKFSGKDVIVIATRRTVRPPKKGSAAKCPRSRTLTSVHEGILEDVVQPAEIVGKRIRYRLDGSRIMKIFLDPKSRNETEYKLESYSAVYRKLCGKDVVFEYPATEA